MCCRNCNLPSALYSPQLPIDLFVQQSRFALEATLTQTVNEHSEPFKAFVSKLESFLVEERGELTLNRGISDAQRLISRARDSLKQKSDMLEGKLRLSAVEQQKTLEKIGEISGFDVKIQTFKETLIDEALSDVSDSWNQWVEDLDDRLIRKSEEWTTRHEDKRSIVSDYANQFLKDISEDLDEWTRKTVMQDILKLKGDELESEIIKNIASIEHSLQTIDKDTGASLYKQFELSGLGVNLNFYLTLRTDAIKDAKGFCGELGLTGSGMIVAGALAFTGFGLLPIMLAGGAVGGVVGMLFGRDAEEMKSELKMEAFNKGIDKFVETSEEILTKIAENIESIFDQKVKDFHEAVSGSISMLCNLLESQESILNETLVQKETESALIQQKSLQLKAIETALNDLTGTALS